MSELITLAGAEWNRIHGSHTNICEQQDGPIHRVIDLKPRQDGKVGWSWVYNFSDPSVQAWKYGAAPTPEDAAAAVLAIQPTEDRMIYDGQHYLWLRFSTDRGPEWIGAVHAEECCVRPSYHEANLWQWERRTSALDGFPIPAPAGLLGGTGPDALYCMHAAIEAKSALRRACASYLATLYRDLEGSMNTINIQLPADTSMQALAQALDSIGLGLDPAAKGLAFTRTGWPPHDASLCGHQDCRREAIIHSRGRNFCAKHWRESTQTA